MAVVKIIMMLSDSSCEFVTSILMFVLIKRRCEIL